MLCEQEGSDVNLDTYLRLSEMNYKFHMLYGPQPAALTYRAAHNLSVGTA